MTVGFAASPPAELAFIGRAREIREIGEFIRAAGLGGGRLLLVEAAAGVGKTRLLHEVMRSPVGYQVIWAVGDPVDRTPLGVLAEAFDCRRTSRDERRAQIAALLSTAASASAEVGAARSASPVVAAAGELCVGLLEDAASEKPVVLCLDDAHWADHSTLTTVTAAVRRLRGLPFAVIAATRPSPAVVAAFASVDPVILRVPLFDQGETADCVAQLVRSVHEQGHAPRRTAPPPSTTILHAALATGGNPLLITTLVRSILHDPRTDSAIAGPTDSAAVVRRMLLSVPAEVVQFLEVAAVIGREIDLELVAGLLGMSISTATRYAGQAIAADVVEAADDVLRFRHDMFRDALMAQLRQEQLEGVHLLAADCLHRGGHPPLRVAHHLACGQAAATVEMASTFAAVAAAVVSIEPHRAVGLLERVVALTDAASDESAAHQLALADAFNAAGRFEDSLRLLARLQLVLCDHPSGNAHVQLSTTRALVGVGRRAEALAQLNEVLSSGALSERERGHALVDAAELHWMDFDITASMARSAEAMQLAERIDGSMIALRASAALARSAGIQGDADAGLRHARSAQEFANRLGPEFNHVARTALGVALINAGRFREGLEELEECRCEAEVRGDTWTVAVLLGTMTLGRFQNGDWAHLSADAEAVAGIANDLGGGPGVLLTSAIAGIVLLRQGNARGARMQLGRARIAASGLHPDPTGTAALLAFEALMYEHDGDVGRAAEGFDALMGALAQFGIGAETIIVTEAVRVAMAARLSTAAARYVVVARRAADISPTPTRRALANLCAALTEGDAAQLERAAEAAALTERQWETAIAFEAAARAAAAEGRPNAESLTAEAALRFDALGCHPRGAAVRSLGVSAPLTDRFARLPDAAPTSVAQHVRGAEQLSSAEERVLALVAQGRSNAQIAAEQFVSKRTVESHVSSLYRKLCVETRVGLAMVARSRGRERSRRTAVGQ